MCVRERGEFLMKFFLFSLSLSFFLLSLSFPPISHTGRTWLEAVLEYVDNSFDAIHTYSSYHPLPEYVGMIQINWRKVTPECLVIYDNGIGMDRDTLGRSLERDLFESSFWNVWSESLIYFFLFIHKSVRALTPAGTADAEFRTQYENLGGRKKREREKCM